MSWIGQPPRKDVKRVRAWRVRPGDEVLGFRYDHEAWLGRARPVISEVWDPVVRVRRRFIAPHFDYDDRGSGSSGYGPMDWVEIKADGDRELPPVSQT